LHHGVADTLGSIGAIMPATVSREFESNSVSPLDSYEKALYDAATAAQAREPPGIQELHNESEWRSLCRFDQRGVIF
jgi:hypothetical protein